MNYTILKSIIETSISQYICQACHNKIDENSIHLRSVGEGVLDFTVVCPHCNTEAHMHAEIGSAQLNGFIHGNEKNVNEKMKKQNANAIKESDIAIIEKNLHEKNSIEDLLN